MRTLPILFPATFVKRYKRFFTDVLDLQNNLVTVHCPNTGSMRHCQVEGSPCWYSLSDNPKRKLPGTLEIVTTTHGNLAGVNTIRANYLVRQAIDRQFIKELTGYDQVTAEVRYGEEKSRIDFLLKDTAGRLRDCYLEVKNVTMDMGKGLATFPDSVTSRGTKHLRELISMVEDGHRAILFFCVQLTNVERVEVAAEIDPVYAQTLALAISRGVEVMAWGAKISSEEIVLQKQINCLQDLPRLERED